MAVQGSMSSAGAIPHSTARPASVPADSLKTHCINGHPFDAENTYRRENGWRVCIECRRDRNRGYKEAKRTGRRRGAPFATLVFDALVADGGWLTTDGLALMTGRKYEAVRRASHRMRERGWVESRKVLLTYKSHRRGFDERLEWRAVADLDQVARVP